MRRALNTLVGRLAILQLLIYAVLLPVLFYGLETAANSKLMCVWSLRTFVPTTLAKVLTRRCCLPVSGVLGAGSITTFTWTPGRRSLWS